MIPYLRYDDMYKMPTGYTFRAIERVHLAGDQIDVRSVITVLKSMNVRDGKTLLDIVGGENYLYDLMKGAGVNIQTYARRVVQASLARSILVASDVLGQIGKAGLSSGLTDLQAVVPQAIRDIMVRMHTLSDQNMVNLYDVIDEFTERITSESEDDSYEPGISTGLTNLDKITLGWRKGKLYIFAAPSGWGKTAFLLCEALAALRQGKRVLFISLEMGIDEMLERIMTIIAQVDYTEFQTRKWSTATRNRIPAAAAELKAIRESKAFNLVTFERPTVAQIESKLTELQLNPGYDIVFIDYVGPDTISLAKSTGSDDRDELTKATEFYSALKGWKKDYNIPIVVGAQMNRNWDKRKGKKPVANDLYFGTQGNFATDFLAFIYHEKLVKGDEAETDAAQLVIRKNRSGPNPGDVTALLNWKPEYLTFSTSSEGEWGEL
jgi:replicative DNA helicase